MTIQPGQSIPAVPIKHVTASGIADATAAEVQTYDRTVTFGNGQKTKLRRE